MTLKRLTDVERSALSPEDSVAYERAIEAEAEAAVKRAPRIASWEYCPETEMPIALCTADADILTATTDEDENAFIDISLVDTRRIQAAWNAVEEAGLTTTALECGVITDLLAACHIARQVCRYDAGEGRKSYDLAFVRERIEAAIAKAGEKE